MENADFPDLAGESRDIWDQNARWWDARMGEGNDWHLSLIAPAVERLLGIMPGERVLELACGNGQFARRLASMGARVLATDSSAEFLDCARQRTRENWAGEPLDSYQRILNYARTTRTQTGLKVTAYLDRRHYPCGVKPTPEQIVSLRLHRHETLPHWNYTIKPQM